MTWSAGLTAASWPTVVPSYAGASVNLTGTLTLRLDPDNKVCFIQGYWQTVNGASVAGPFTINPNGLLPVAFRPIAPATLYSASGLSNPLTVGTDGSLSLPSGNSATGGVFRTYYFTDTNPA